MNKTTDDLSELIKKSTLGLVLPYSGRTKKYYPIWGIWL